MALSLTRQPCVHRLSNSWKLLSREVQFFYFLSFSIYATHSIWQKVLWGPSVQELKFCKNEVLVFWEHDTEVWAFESSNRKRMWGGKLQSMVNVFWSALCVRESAVTFRNHCFNRDPNGFFGFWLGLSHAVCLYHWVFWGSETIQKPKSNRTTCGGENNLTTVCTQLEIV